MRLFIAEKPSLGRAIADGLGAGQKREGYIECGQDWVTWCFGHLLEQFDPEDYDPALRSWNRATLPIIPATWKLKPRDKAAAQLAIIGKLLKEAISVVNAGDPDREGQLLVDEVLEHFAYQGAVKRIWLASLDIRSVQKSLATLTDNAKHAPLRDAARARSQADWLVGINATRAMTVYGQECGQEGVLSLGRVQTPTLGLVVTRDREIAVFKAVDYFVIQATVQHSAGEFLAMFVPAETQAGLDSQERLVDRRIVMELVTSTRGATGVILEVTREKKRKAAPLPHCLSSLQKAASAKFGMTAQDVLNIAQALYEKKLTTYPRSDCRYLPSEQFADSARILVALGKIPGLESIAGSADSSLRGSVWDTKKITAHHAIIPTGEVPGNLLKAERELYMLISTAYLLQFYPPLHYEAQKIALAFSSAGNETRWEAKGRLVLDPGWTRAGDDGDKDDDDDAKEKDKNQALPAVDERDQVTCASVEALSKKTSPPPRFTEGTLIEAMANVHRFVTDVQAKATLKENEGIGTEATRAGILETLKSRKYLVPNNKALVSTALGQRIIDRTPTLLKDPITTAQWERRLGAIAAGQESFADFMAKQVHVLPDLLNPILSMTPQLAPGAIPCPTCGKALRKCNGFNGFFWACSGYPECRQTLPDDNGKPGERKESVPPSGFKCPECKTFLKRIKTRNGTFCFVCFAETKHKNSKPHFFDDLNGTPNFT